MDKFSAGDTIYVSVGENAKLEFSSKKTEMV